MIIINQFITEWMMGKYVISQRWMKLRNNYDLIFVPRKFDYKNIRYYFLLISQKICNTCRKEPGNYVLFSYQWSLIRVHKIFHFDYGDLHITKRSLKGIDFYFLLKNSRQINCKFLNIFQTESIRYWFQ